MDDIVKPLEVLSRLRLKGVGLAMDDYGTGASTMQQLKRIPFTDRKIDREFVAGAPQDPAARAMLASSTSLAKELGLTTVAEGVETKGERSAEHKPELQSLMLIAYAGSGLNKQTGGLEQDGIVRQKERTTKQLD